MQKFLSILVLWYFIVQLALTFTACKHQSLEDDDLTPIDTTDVPIDTTDPGDTTVVGTPCDPQTVYFERDILPIFLSNCAFSGCHNAASHQDGVVLDNYENIMQTGEIQPFDLDDSEVYEVLTEDDEDKRMPPPPAVLGQAQIQLIAKWIQQGAQNLTCDENAGACDVTDVSYAQNIVPLINNQCKGCHSGAAPSGGVNLSTHAGVKPVALDGRLYGVIAWLPGYPKMPQGGAQLSDCTIDQFKAWIDAGAPNN